MSYAGPRGDKHYRLYEIPSHLFIPSVCVRPWERKRRNKGEGGGMEVEAGERERLGGNRESGKGQKDTIK